MTVNQRLETIVLLLMALGVLALLWVVARPVAPPGSPLPPSPVLHSATVALGLEPRAWLPLVLNPAANLVYNASFENGVGGACRYFVSGEGEHLGCYQEQRAPLGWTFGWRENYGQSYCHSGVTGRPEANLSDTRHPSDVSEGAYSAHAFTFWRCGRFWWEQVVDTESNAQYTVSAMARTWPGNTRMYTRICLDSVCTAWFSTGGSWLALERTVTAQGDTARVVLECTQEWPERNGDCWFDSVALRAR